MSLKYSNSLLKNTTTTNPAINHSILLLENVSQKVMQAK